MAFQPTCLTERTMFVPNVDVLREHRHTRGVTVEHRPDIAVPRVRRVEWPVLAVVAGVVVLITHLAVRPVSDLSPWLHLRVGELLVGGGRFGPVDPFSATATRPYLPTQWLPSVGAYELEQLLGLPAVAWLRALGILALFLVLCLGARRHLRGLGGILLGAVVTLVCLPAMTERPQTLGMVLLAATVLGWWGSLLDGRPRWWLVPLGWVFASSHGLWAVGLGVGVLVCLGRLLDETSPRQVARLSLVALGQLVAAAVTPLGPALLVTPFTVGSNGREFVSEWQPSTIASVTVVGVVVLVGVLLVLGLRDGRRMPRSRLLILAAVVGLAASTARTAGPAAVLLAPLLAEQLSHRSQPMAVRRELPLWVLVAVVLCAAVVALPLAQARATVPIGVPAALAGQLRSLPPGTPILAQADVSGWVLWSAPQLSPVVDIRNEAYAP